MNFHIFTFTLKFYSKIPISVDLTLFADCIKQLLYQLPETLHFQELPQYYAAISAECQEVHIVALMIRLKGIDNL